MSTVEQSIGTPSPTTGTLRPPLTSAEKYEKLAFTFCKMGTTGLIAWALTPPIFILLVATIAVVLYAKAVTLGVLRSRCILRRPLLIITFWAVVGIADAVWLFAFR
ncbi:MAG TPA: hypothetical protein VM409_08760 [Chloroflexia bacterium]|nr:hypothetical protein [Chloroflexia bacterium]